MSERADRQVSRRAGEREKRKRDLTDAFIRLSVQQLCRERFVLVAGGHRPVQVARLNQPASTNGSNCLGERSADAQLDVGACFHAGMRVGGGRAAACRCQDRRVAIEWSAAQASASRPAHATTLALP